MFSKKNERIGQSSISRDGKKCTVTTYLTCENFIIQFDDGKKKIMTNWNAYKSGKFNYKKFYKNCPTKYRIGTQKQMNNGLFATIIKYINSHNITIRFEDGIEKGNVSYRDFNNGNVSHPLIQGVQTSYNELTLSFYLKKYGFKKVRQRSKESKKLGLLGKEIDLYNKKLKIAVEYDGEYSHKDIRCDILKNKLLFDLGITLYRFREKRCPTIDGNTYVLNDNKYLSKSLEKNINIFISDVLMQPNVKINFENDKQLIIEYIRKKKRETSHLFEQNIMNNGLRCKIISMTSNNDISVQFDDGQIVSGENYKRFIKGLIMHPDDIIINTHQIRLHERRIMKNGYGATITRYEGWNKVEILFDNGENTITSWDHFINGSVALPSVYIKNHIGDKVLQKRGMVAEIISARDANHIDVKFEDNTIIKNRKYADFIKGYIANPNLIPYTNKKEEERIGMNNIMNSGKVCKIIRYGCANDIDVQFKDGSVSKHKKYANFISGSIK